MATPRGHIVDDEAVGTYHCISRCVRKAMLCGEGLEHRRTWIESRIADLQEAMAIDLTAWHVMANHMHLVVTTRPDIVREWSDREVAERHLRMCPGRWRGGKLGTPTNRNLVGGRSNALQLGTHRRQMKVKRRMKGPSLCVVGVATKMGIIERRAAASAFARVVERFSSRSVRFVGCGSTSWPAGLSPSDRVAAQLLRVSIPECL